MYPTTAIGGMDRLLAITVLAISWTDIALAALVVSHGKLFPPGDRSGLETATDAGISQVVVTGVGHWRGEGLALVEAAG